MPSFSGLWDGVHGDGYAAMPKSDALPPVQRGIVRALMQGRGMHGHVNALGRGAPASIAQVDAQLDTVTMRGGYDYANRQDDPANTVDVTNIDANAQSNTVTESKSRPADATETDLSNTYDTTLRNGHPADMSLSGVTSQEVDEQVASAGP